LSNDVTIVSGARRSIENFRGDYQGLARMMRRSWEENSHQGLSYSGEFLESFLTAPGASASLQPALYGSDVLIGFASGFRRLLKHNGHPLQLITSSFLSVLPEYKKFGFGIVLWSELVKRSRAEGFDGMLNFCVDGEPMNGMVEGSCRRLGLSVQRIFSIRYMSALLGSKDFDAPASRPEPVCVDDFLELCAPLLSSQPLARSWTSQEAKWQCLHRTNSVVAHSLHGSRRGILTGYVMPVLDREQTKCLLVEDVLWDELLIEERIQLLRQFLSQAVSSGARMATVPILGYADLGPFKTLRFFPTRRVLHCYLTLFNSVVLPERLPSMYLDVF
jgi:hypothetical protein